jgi:thiol-disulfide isomerase/thioredoxin
MHEIIGLENLNNIIYNNKDHLILLYFGAVWCSPCKKLKNKMEDKYELLEMKDLVICYLDIDNNDELVKIYEVKNIPTLFFIKINENNEVNILHKIIGYDWIGIKFAYNKIINNY